MATQEKYREASFDSDGVVVRGQGNFLDLTTTPSARTNEASQFFLDRAATPPPLRRGADKLRPSRRNHTLDSCERGLEGPYAMSDAA